MKKLLILFFVFLLALSVCGCGASTTESDVDFTPTGHVSSTNENTPTGYASSTNENTPSGLDSSTNEKSKITEEEALEIASQHWGIKSGDKDEETGFTFLIMPVESSNDNFAIDLKWLVDNHHYSTVDSIEIDPYTGKIVNIY